MSGAKLHTVLSVWLHNVLFCFLPKNFSLVSFLFDCDDLTLAFAESLVVRGRGATKHLGITIRHGSPGTAGGSMKLFCYTRGAKLIFSQNVVSKEVIRQDNRLTRAWLEYGIKLQQEIGRELQTYQKKGKNPSKPRTKQRLSGVQQWASWSVSLRSSPLWLQEHLLSLKGSSHCHFLLWFSCTCSSFEL